MLQIIADHIPGVDDSARLIFEAQQVMARIDPGDDRREKFVFFDVCRAILAQRKRDQHG
jgi:hypothetical protein